MKKRLILLLCAAFSAALCAGLFLYWHPTHYAISDRFVLGKTKAELITRYGTPHREEDARLTYQIRDNTPEWIMSCDDSLWYEIVFEDGIATTVSLREGTVGG